jgi:pullulanase/glycogen debranching enzyme
MNAKISLNWFVWSDEDGFEYFQTEAEAICAAREKIPAFCVDNYWEEGVDEIKVGCMTQEVGIVDRIETIDGYTCNYQLKPFENH